MWEQPYFTIFEPSYGTIESNSQCGAVAVFALLHPIDKNRTNKDQNSYKRFALFTWSCLGKFRRWNQCVTMSPFEMLKKLDAILTASSKSSTSSKTTRGLLPPSSRVHRLRLDWAHATCNPRIYHESTFSHENIPKKTPTWTIRPTTVDPVNATLSTCTHIVKEKIPCMF